MCGIAGIYNYADPDRRVDCELLTQMTRTLAHRGPDAEGFHVSGNLGFGHRRLSIVDLSPSGAQPMLSADGTRCLTYNGEFYNHREHRERLTAAGVRFRGPSDTETMLELLGQEGPGALAEAAGIYAFGYWDGARKRLTLGRDPLGVKQVYYYDDGRRILFASEIKALLQCAEVPREADAEAINQYLHFHTSLFERTFFRHIRQVRAGEYLQVTPYGARCTQYWKLDQFSSIPASAPDQIAELRERLGGIVEQQLMADVPVGSFFSGGIDSSAIAAFAARSGSRLQCFGVHFADQGVIDERPYQEAAARALGLDLHLITAHGESFADDMGRLMYQQDQPTIGAAMFPMAQVSRLAAGSVKACLGGQAADEIFGGYARYALGRPVRVLRSWLAGRRGQGEGQAAAARVGGNLGRQFAERATVRRLVGNARHLLDWEHSYFEHFAKVPEAAWLRLFAAPEMCSRDRCRQMFRETVGRSAATDPVDKIMHWDMQTYLTGLFHQDDRMSMAASLESRVPFADPRLVRYAFQLGADRKLRGGASKWILRQAVADILPASILNRRKVGFDTPAESWMKGPSAAYVRETLLSSAARERGFWNVDEVTRLLETPHAPHWFGIVWKALCIEVWATTFLDGVSAPSAEAAPIVIAAASSAVAAADAASPIVWADRLQEMKELGVRRTVARIGWEVKTRVGSGGSPARLHAREPRRLPTAAETLRRLPYARPAEVAERMRPLLGEGAEAELGARAREATRGRLRAFESTVTIDFGQPPDWHRCPVSAQRWPSAVPGTRALRYAGPGADVKNVWEAARFPHAYLLARAAAFDAAAAPVLAEAFTAHVLHFAEHNPPGSGIHWSVGMEVGIRLLAWSFGQKVFEEIAPLPAALHEAVHRHLLAAGRHIASHIAYARHAVYNNHLLTEALGLYVAGTLVPEEPEARRWRKQGRDLLEAQAPLQFYSDGGNIQDSHNYHRTALQNYLFAVSFARTNQDAPPEAWIAAMGRSLDFLVAHQNESDGWLPNYGANDGSMPLPLSSCEFPDFRPVLQAASLCARGERLYPPGPWDETAAWALGAGSLDAPQRTPRRTSVSFAYSGFHVLRGAEPGCFGAFRCGSLRDRFAQIDMLHLDVWWKGHNVLVDAGSYRYNGAETWHQGFMRTATHNTIELDGRDQMLHLRPFKTIHSTKAELTKFEDTPGAGACAGAHYGYRRHPGGCVHRRAIAFAKDDLWIAVDTITGSGEHRARLQWLGGAFPYTFDAGAARLELGTPSGPFTVSVLDGGGAPCGDADVVAGRGLPKPRGWLSRTYGEKVAVPSLAATQAGGLPLTFVSVLCAGRPDVVVAGGDWTVATDGATARFRLEGGAITELEVDSKDLVSAS